MSETSGVCTIVPRGQDSFRPRVYGMGILVNDREIVTCAHVIDLALGSGWQKSSEPAVVRVCFPFARGVPCVEGTVDSNRWFPSGRTKDGEPADGEPADVAVIQLAQDAPPSCRRAILQEHDNEAPAKVYGFRGAEVSGVWRSHPNGEWAVGRIIGQLPGGRAQFDGLRKTGARVEKGYSGGGVYDCRRDVVVGMIVESDRDKEAKIAQFIDVPSLRSVLGKAGAGVAPESDSWEPPLPAHAVTCKENKLLSIRRPPPGGSPPIVGRASVLTALRAVLTTGPAPARPGDLSVDSSGVIASCRRPRKLYGQNRRLQQDLVVKATDRLELEARGVSRLEQRLDAGSYPLLVSIEHEGACALLADARQLLRHATAPGRVALLGEVGSGQHEVALLLMQTLADAAQAVAQRRPHFAEHLADLLPAVVSVERWAAGESLLDQLPEELRQLLTRKPKTVERCWLVMLSDHLSSDEKEIQQFLAYLVNEPVFGRCRHQLLVLHSSTRSLVPSGWDLVTLGGLHIERLPDALWRRQFRRWMAWTAADHLPVSLAAALKSREDFAVALVRYYMQQHAPAEVPESRAKLVYDHTLPVVLAHAYQNGTFALGIGALVELYRNDRAIFPRLASPEDAPTLLAQLSFLFRSYGASLVVIPSCLAAELTATGLLRTHLTPRHDADPYPFELSVRACWAHVSGERLPANVPHLVNFVHTSSQAPDSTELLEAVRELDAATGQRLMHSHLAESLVELLRPIINEPEVGRLLRSMHSATRALWAFEELTTSSTRDPSIIGILLDLIEPDYIDALFALAPGRQRFFIETVSLCPDRHLLERFLGPLARAHPALLPAAVIDRLSRPHVLGGRPDEH